MRIAGATRVLGLGAALASVIGVAGLAAGAARAEEAGAGESPPDAEAEPVPPVGLDALLRLPSDTTRAGPPEGGAAVSGPDREYWESRFTAVRGELEEARSGLEHAQNQLEEMARKTEGWQMAAPGAQVTAENTPVSYKLRQDIRRYREEVESAERRLRDLEVEASLAGVPAEWRESSPQRDASPEP
jgi:hypothetical protein